MMNMELDPRKHLYSSITLDPEKKNVAVCFVDFNSVNSVPWLRGQLAAIPSSLRDLDRLLSARPVPTAAEQLPSQMARCLGLEGW